MGIKSIIKTDRLFWLGRYTERVYTTLKFFAISYDKMIEAASGYEKYCEDFDIPNIYASKEEFMESYPFDKDNPDSIRSNLTRAYDNAIELREEIGSESLSFIQLAGYAMDRAEKSDAPAVEFQKVTDNILAFWGCIDDQVEDENTRNLIKVGKRVERIDLYGRLKMPKECLAREVHRLTGRVKRCSIHYRLEVIEKLNELIKAEKLDYLQIVKEIDSFLDN